MAIYCGARGTARASELLEYQRRGWDWEAKEDGLYVELVVGVRRAQIAKSGEPVRSDGRFDARYRGSRPEPGVIVQARYRSGEVTTLRDLETGRGSRLSDVLGLRTPWAPGTRLIGELMVQTPRARSWQDTHSGIRGVVLFDLLSEGLELGWRETQDLAARGIVPVQDWSQRPNAERRVQLERMVGQLEGRASKVLSLVRRGSSGHRGAYREIVESGNEGIVLVDGAAPAGAGKRKVKPIDSLDCRVVQVIPEQGVALVCLGSRPPFRVSIPKFQIRVGQIVAVQHRGWYDESLTPRHPVLKSIRDDLAV